MRLEADGYLEIEISRESYCEHSRVRVHVQDIDPESVEISLAEEGRVAFRCRNDESCALNFQKRKKQEEGAWVDRDADWLAEMPGRGSHPTASFSLLLSGDRRAADLAAKGLAYVVRSAVADPVYAEPADPFSGQVASAAAAPAAPEPAPGPQSRSMLTPSNQAVPGTGDMSCKVAAVASAGAVDSISSSSQGWVDRRPMA